MYHSMPWMEKGGQPAPHLCVVTWVQAARCVLIGSAANNTLRAPAAPEGCCTCPQLLLHGKTGAVLLATQHGRTHSSLADADVNTSTLTGRRQAQQQAQQQAQPLLSHC